MLRTKLSSAALSGAALPDLLSGRLVWRARAQTSSIQAYKPTAGILDYACTKGAIVAFTKGLGMDLFPKHGIRVNTVAPGPVWCAAPAACTQSLCTKLLLRFTFSRGSI